MREDMAEKRNEESWKFGTWRFRERGNFDKSDTGTSLPATKYFLGSKLPINLENLL